jgi:heme exporter protein C
MIQYFYQFASLKAFYQVANRAIPWLIILTLALFMYGLVGGLFLAPADYQQGDAFRLIYIHVPSAALSLGIYVSMAIFSGVALIWRIKLADILAKESGPIGAWFTLIALVTGAFWGKPMWGTWWIWDARLTSELILLFLFLGVIALRSAIPDPEKAMRASGILSLVGIINIPIIHYSVYWWNTLHQQSTLLKLQRPSIDSAMLYPLLAMLLAFLLYYILVLLMRTRNEILVREQHTKWVKDYVK